MTEARYGTPPCSVSLVAPADCEGDEALARVAAVRARFGAIARAAMREGDKQPTRSKRAGMIVGQKSGL